METVEYIMRVRIVNDERAAGVERALMQTARDYGGRLSRVVREEHETYALHKSRKTLVRP